jgi:hypothetical protein
MNKISQPVHEIEDCRHSPSKGTERACNGNERRHLTERQHSSEDDGSDDGVGDQHRCRTTCSKTLSRAQEQTSADCTYFMIRADLELLASK